MDNQPTYKGKPLSEMTREELEAAVIELDQRCAGYSRVLGLVAQQVSDFPQKSV